MLPRLVPIKYACFNMQTALSLAAACLRGCAINSLIHMTSDSYQSRPEPHSPSPSMGSAPSGLFTMGSASSGSHCLHATRHFSRRNLLSSAGYIVTFKVVSGPARIVGAASGDPSAGAGQDPWCWAACTRMLMVGLHLQSCKSMSTAQAQTVIL